MQSTISQVRGFFRLTQNLVLLSIKHIIPCQTKKYNQFSISYEEDHEILPSSKGAEYRERAGVKWQFPLLSFERLKL